MNKSLLAPLLLFLIASCTESADRQPSDQNEIVQTAQVIVHGQDDIVYTVEIVNTETLRARGLMYRAELAEDAGMLFIFEEAKPRTFWMKNTLIPLDIIFIDESLTILNIENAVPCTQDPCQMYESKGAAKYVLEVNAHQGHINGFGAGGTVSFTLP